MHRRTFLQAGLLGALGSCTTSSSSPVSAASAARRRGAPAGEPLRLNANENPLGMSPRARQALLDNLSNANRYPYALRGPLTEAIARAHGVAADQVVLGAGSTEVLQMAVQAFATAEAAFVLATPTFEDVPHYATPFPVRLHKVPLLHGGAHDVQQMRERTAAHPGPVLVYVCNPNNPTGTLTPPAELEDWVADAPERVAFLFDEAYFEYAEGAAGHAGMQRWIRRPGVLVVRTFSKVHGMAGLRLGYGLAHPETAARLQALQCRNNANQLVEAAALASLRDPDHVRRSLADNARARRLVCETLDDLGLSYLPSHTNFVFHRIPGELREYIERMRSAGILVGRPFPPMTGYNRVSLATPDEMGRFVEVLREFRSRGWV